MGFSVLGRIEFVLIRCLLNLYHTEASFLELKHGSYFN